MEDGIIQNCMYVIDEQYRIVYYNDAMKRAYENVKEGEVCYKVICKQNQPCSFCPMNNHSKEGENICRDVENQNWDSLHYAEITRLDNTKGYVVLFKPLGETKNRFEEQKNQLAQNLWIDSERYGIIGGYCEDGFPLYYANDTMIKMMGYADYEEMKNRIENRVANTIHPDDMLNVLNDIGEKYYLGMTYETVYRMVKKDGSCFWVRDRGKVIESEDGRLAIISVCIDLSADMTFQEDEKKKNHQVEEIIEAMSEVAREKENQYKSAIISGATAVYEVNLSKDILKNVSGIEKNKEINLAEKIGLSIPCSFSEYIACWAEKMTGEVKHEFLEFNSIEHLMQCYEAGNLELNIEYETLNTYAEKQNMRKTYVLMKDAVSGDINALIVSRDITKEVSAAQQREQQMKKQMDIIKALSAEYSTIYLLNWEKEELQMYSTTNEIIMSTESLRGTRSYAEMMNIYAKNMVHPDDMGRFLAELKLDNVRNGINENRVYDVNYRRVLNGQTDYAQIRFMPINSRDVAYSTVCAIRSVDDIIKEEQRKNEVIDALSYGYSSSFIVDWDTDELELFKLIDETHRKHLHTFMGYGYYEPGMINYLDLVASENEIKKLKRELSAEKIREKLLRNPIYTVLFERNTNKKMDHVQFRFVLVKRQDGKKIIVISVRDMDKKLERELRQKRRLEQALVQARVATESKSAFLSNMSHDIRTPMNAVMGFAGMAKKYIDDKEKVLDCIDKVEMSGRHMLRIINDVLDMARIESGKMELDISLTNVIDEIHNIDALFRTSMEEKGLKFDVEVNAQDVWLVVDGMRINQIIINLISNAMKYTKPGGNVMVQFNQTGVKVNGKVPYEVRVKDTGIGMSKEYQKHLFEAFERERTATASGVQGTGLGLAISKKIANLLGGKISCTSEVGVGTEFVFSFTAVVDKEHKGVCENPIDFAKYMGKRILVVEDNALNREIAVDILEDCGLLVDTAEDGSIALEKLRNAEEAYYDLVLMDIQMPYVDGYAATQLIRSDEEMWYSRLPIIAMTANAFEEDRKRAFAAGMDGHLAKPMDRKKLVEILQQAFMGALNQRGDKVKV